MESKSKTTTLSVCVLGHVDAGKSTLVGHLKWLYGQVDPDTMLRYERQSKEMGKRSFKYAWVVNTLWAERERGITIDWHSTSLTLSNTFLNFLNGPGHRDYLKNMIKCAFMSDTALLVVAANEEEFEYGIKGQMPTHINLCHYLNLKGLLVCVNKMDLVSFSHARFLEVVEILTQKYLPMKATFIPISAFNGDNLIEKSGNNMPWYQGPTVLEYLENISINQ